MFSNLIYYKKKKEKSFKPCIFLEDTKDYFLVKSFLEDSTFYIEKELVYTYDDIKGKYDSLIFSIEKGFLKRTSSVEEFLKSIEKSLEDFKNYNVSILNTGIKKKRNFLI